jgi:hypothetical protein
LFLLIEPKNFRVDPRLQQISNYQNNPLRCREQRNSLRTHGWYFLNFFEPSLQQKRTARANPRGNIYSVLVKSQHQRVYVVRVQNGIVVNTDDHVRCIVYGKKFYPAYVTIKKGLVYEKPSGIIIARNCVPRER